MNERDPLLEANAVVYRALRAAELRGLDAHSLAVALINAGLAVAGGPERAQALLQAAAAAVDAGSYGPTHRCCTKLH